MLWAVFQASHLHQEASQRHGVLFDLLEQQRREVQKGHQAGDRSAEMVEAAVQASSS
jgi:hypothetical protein